MKLRKVVIALVCVLGLGSIAQAQFTTITASKIFMGGILIPSGTVTFTPVGANGQPIAFSQSGGGLNSPSAFSCTITAGAIVGSCQIPDAALTNPANILYSVQVTNTTQQHAFTLQPIPNITGATFALDDYGPPAFTSNVEPIQVSYGTAAPPSTCVSPSFYIQNASGGKLFMCVAGSPVLVTGSGGASVTAEAMQAALASNTGCATAGNPWVPATNTCPTPSASSGPAPISGAIADFDFLQGSGTVLTDISGNGNNGTLGTGSALPTWTPSGLAFTVGENVSLPSALNGAETFFFGFFINPITNTAQLTNMFPMLLGASNGSSGLNLLTAQVGPTGAFANPPAFATTIFANSLKTVGVQLISGFHVLTYVLGTGSGSLDHIYIDGVQVTYIGQGSSAGLQTAGNFLLGSSNTGAFAGSGFLGTMYRATMFSGNSLTLAQIQAIAGQIRSDVAARGVPVTPPPVQQVTPTLYCVGDSITAGFGATTPFCSELSLTNQTYNIVNDGIISISMAAISGSEPNRVAPMCNTSQGPSTAIVFAGTNDFADIVGATGTTVMASLASEIQTLHGGGCRVLVGTMLSRTTVDPKKDAYDALILTQAKTAGADGIVDFAANPILGADGANSGTPGTIEACPGATTFFQADCTHPTTAGQALLATAASNSLNYYNGSKLSNPNVVTATTYQMLSSDGAITAAPTANAAYTMPDCTGPSGESYVISNPQSAFTVTIVGGANQPINGLATAITIPSNSTVTLRDVANPKNVSGCHWAM
jgi:trimeric autotransporter adhesin